MYICICICVYIYNIYLYSQCRAGISLFKLMWGCPDSQEQTLERKKLVQSKRFANSRTKVSEALFQTYIAMGFRLCRVIWPRAGDAVSVDFFVLLLGSVLFPCAADSNLIAQ